MDQGLVSQTYPPFSATNRASTAQGSGILSVLSPGYLSEVDFESTLVGGYGGDADDEETNIGRTEEVAIVEISQHGDVILELTFKRGRARFRVSSQVLCLASPVFRAMLGPNSSFKEACELREHASAGDISTAEPYVLPIEDDDPEGLAIVLFAIHLQNDKVPLYIKEKRTIWNMAIICDKYDCTAALSVWVDTWAKGWKKRVFHNSGHGLWLFVGWTFGLADVFKFISKKIILEGHFVGGKGKFLSKEGWNLDGLAIPGPVMEAIRQQRRTTIVSMIEDALSVLDKYLVGGNGKPLCCATNPSEDCDLVILGSITREYQTRIGLYPEHDKFLLMSVKDVQETLKSVRIRYLGENPARFGGHANACSRPLQELVNKLDGYIAAIEGLRLEDFGSRQGLPVRVETGTNSSGSEEAYNPSLALLRKLFYPRRRVQSHGNLL